MRERMSERESEGEEPEIEECNPPTRVKRKNEL